MRITAPKAFEHAWWLMSAALVSMPAFADVEFEPEVLVGVTRTDNLTNAPDNEEAQTVYQLVPAFRLAQESARLTSDVAYRLEAYHYRQRDDGATFDVFDGRTSAALDPENFFLNSGASRTQSIRDPESPIPTSNLPLTGNRVDRDDLYFGPSYRYAFGDAVTATADLRRTWVKYDDEPPEPEYEDIDLVDSVLDSVSIDFDNHRGGDGFTWSTRYRSRRTEYDGYVPWEHRQVLLELGFWAAEGLRVFASGGKESAWNEPFDPSLEDSLWEVGFARQLGERFTAEVAAGERSFGSSARASVDYAFGRGSMRLSFDETPTTQGRERFNRGGLLDPDLPLDLLLRPSSVERYVSSRLEWYVDFEFRATQISLSVYDDEHAERFNFDGTQLPDEAQTGLRVALDRQIGRRTSFFVDGYRSERDLADGSVRQLRRASIGVNFDVGRRTQASARYDYERDQNEASGQGPGHTENRIAVYLTLTF
jgi:hypothetical protein